VLDQGVYLCSIRTMYRVLAEHDEVRERRRQLRRPVYQKPELLAEGPNQVWSWDITKLMGPAKWSYFYLYFIIDGVGIISFRATVPPRLPGSVTLFRWSHGFSIAVEPMSSRKKVHLLLPTGSCEQLRKHSNHPLLPHMCQFLLAKFYSSVDVSNFAKTSPRIRCRGESWSVR
jgi:hypothetical protein